MLAALVTKFLGAKGMMYLGIIALVLVVLVGGYLATGRAIHNYAVLEANATILKAQIVTQQQTIAAEQKNAVAWKQALDDYKADVIRDQAIQADADLQRSKIDDAFRKHDVRALAHKRPDLVEGVLNRGSLRAQRMLNCATGGTDCPSPTVGSTPSR